MASVFLSHAHEDKKFVRKLAADLRASGHDIWIDEAEIQIGDSLINKIREGLDQVDFIAAVISDASIESPWVQQELDIASNREIEEGRVVVLPLLISNVSLPGFLKGKFYGDFREPENYDDVFVRLCERLGSGRDIPNLSAEDIGTLLAEVEAAKTEARKFREEAHLHRRIAMVGKSERLTAAIERENAAYPQFAPINATYAFELGSIVVTLHYALWSIAKSMRKGSHPLVALLSLEGRWGDFEAMMEAYEDMLQAQGIEAQLS
jgi:TIR domain